MNRERENFLLFRIRAFSDETALEVLVSEHGEKIRRFLEAKLPTKEDSQDAYSEVWTRFWDYAQSTKIDSTSGLLFTIARGIVASFYRKRARRPEQLSDPLMMGEMHIVHSDVIDKVDVELLKQFVNQLEETDSEIIYMRYIEGYRIKDIAEKIGKTDNATSVTLHRAVKKLRRLICEKFKDL